MIELFNSTGEYATEEFARQSPGVDVGVLRSPHGKSYAKAKAKVALKACRAEIVNGASLSVYSYGNGHLAWFEGDDRAHVWGLIEPELRKKKSKIGDFSCSMWLSDDGSRLLFVEVVC